MNILGGKSLLAPPRQPAALGPQPVSDAASGGGYGMHPAAGGFTPDYSSNILNDPLYRQLQAHVAAGDQAAQGTATTGFGQALGQFGEIPDFQQTASQLGLDPKSPMYQLLFGAANNPNTQASANASTQAGLSTTAGLQGQHQSAIQNLLAGMAARGTVQSGATGVGLRGEEHANTQRQYDARQALLSHLTDISAAYNQQRQAGIGQLQQGLGDATNRQIGLNPNISPATLATLMPQLNIGGGT